LEIVSDEKSIILLDEPDAYIHESKKRELYNIFKTYSMDYNRNILMTTHSPTFVDCGDDSNIIMLKSEGGICKIFDAEKLDSIRELTGSRMNAFFEKDILYCEGTETSIEAKLYPILFPEYNIIPSGGHEEVIHNTKMYNATFGNGYHNAIGIIDWDYKSSVQVEALKCNGVFSISVVEIENILMDTILLQAAVSEFCAAEDGVNKVKQKLINSCSTAKEKQATKYTSNYVISKIKTSLSQENRDIEKFKSTVSEICKIEKIDELYAERLQNFTDYIAQNDYENLITIFDFNHSIDQYINDAIVNRYHERIIKLINKRKDLQDQIKQKYYSDII